MLKIRIWMLCILICTHQSSCIFQDIFKMGKALWKSSQILANADAGASAYIKAASALVGDAEEGVAEVRDDIRKLSSKFDRLEKSMREHFDMLARLVEALPVQISINDQKKDYRSIVNTVIKLHKDLFRHLKDEDKNDGFWHNLAKKSTGDIDSKMNELVSLLAPMYRDVFTGDGLVDLIAQQSRNTANEMCKDTQTLQYQFFRLFATLLLLEMQALQLLSVGHHVLATSESGHQSMVKDAVDNFEERYLSYLVTFVRALNTTPRFLRACDPSNGQWIKDINYFGIGELDYYYHYHRGDRLTCLEPWVQNYCDHGMVDSCLSIKSIDLCSEEGTGRYLSVKTDEETYGLPPSECPGKMESVTRTAQSFFESSLRSYGSGYCLCRCLKYDTNHSISLSMSRANESQNMVIIGAKFVQQNSVLHIQVKQGKLLPDGEIEAASQSWVDLPTNPKTRPITRKFRTITLNNPVLPFGYALVGVQFIDTFNISLKIVGRQYDLTNGILLSSHLEMAPKTLDKYEKLPFAKDSSIYDNLKRKHTSNSDKHWIELEGSEAKYDVGRSTLPLFDGVPVETIPPSPLSGIGLYHKNVEDFAGFISLQLHSLSYKNYLIKLLKSYKASAVLDECNESSCTPDDILVLGDKLYNLMKKITETENEEEIRNNSQIMDGFHEIEVKINSAEYNMGVDNFMSLVRNAINISLSAESARWALKFFPKYIVEKIDTQYNNFLSSMEETIDNSNAFWQNTSDATMPNAINDLETFLFSSLIHPKSKEGFIKVISNQDSIDTKVQCKASQSMQHFLTQIFRTIIVSDVKAVSVLSFAYRMQPVLKRDWREKIMDLRNNFKTRFIRYITDFAEAMETAPGYVRTCAPELAAVGQDKTYFEMGGLGEISYFYYKRKRYPLRPETVLAEGKQRWYKEEDRCKGQLDNCDDAEQIQICRKKNSGKSYEWIKSLPLKSNKKYSCPGGKIDTRYSEKNQHFMCTCNRVAGNYVSLDFVQTDLAENMVITGLRFVRQDGILHIQVKQGKLLPNGWVDPETQNWIPLADSLPKKTISPTTNKFFLGDVIFPSAYAIIGIQFIYDKGFYIELTAQKFDFSNGILLSQNVTKAEDHQTTPEEDSEEKPVHGPKKFRLSSESDSVTLKNSQLDHDDGQKVLPLFNGIPVAVDPPTVIAGVGVFHESTEGNAEYLSLKLHTLRFQQNLQDFLTDSDAGHVFSDN